MNRRQTTQETWKRIAFGMVSRGLTLAVMESCTGGLLSKTITDIPGCGDFFRGGIVSYATDVKILMGVSGATIDRFGVVSRETAAAMAEAALLRLGSSIGIGITGVAGPDTQDGVPVGTVHIAVARSNAS